MNWFSLHLAKKIFFLKKGLAKPFLCVILCTYSKGAVEFISAVPLFFILERSIKMNKLTAQKGYKSFL